MIRFGVNVVAGPASEPVTLDEAKVNAKVDEDEDDDLIELRLIPAAREWVENYCSVKLITQTLDYFFTHFPCEFELPAAPVSAITHIKYTDTNGALQTLAAAIYQVDLYSARARVKPVFNAVWPSVQPDSYNSVQIRAVVGYADADAVPASYKQAMHLLIAYWYANRETVVVGTISSELALTVKNILQQKRLHYFA